MKPYISQNAHQDNDRGRGMGRGKGCLMQYMCFSDFCMEILNFMVSRLAFVLLLKRSCCLVIVQAVFVHQFVQFASTFVVFRPRGRHQKPLLPEVVLPKTDIAHFPTHVFSFLDFRVRAFIYEF